MRDLRLFFNSRQNILGLILVAAFAAVALAAPLISPMDPKNPGAFKAYYAWLMFQEV